MEGLASTFENIANGLGSLIDYINPFSDNFFLKSFFDFLKEALSYINPFDDNFIGKKIIELLGNLLKSLFVPSEDSINGLVNSVKSHFTFIDTITTTVNTLKDMFNNVEALPKITLTLNNNKYYTGTITVMDLSWYAPYKEYGDLIISAFIYVFFLWRIFANLPNIISGVGGGYNDVNIASSDIEAYSRFGFGRRESLTRRQK